jgi:hypothetical protein
MTKVLIDAHTLFDNTPPVDRFSPEYLRAQRTQQEATHAATVATRNNPISVFAIVSNSGILDQEGGTPPAGGWTDFDIAGRAQALAREVSRADVVPFRKATPPVSPQPPRQPAVPMRPAATVHPWKPVFEAERMRKLGAVEPDFAAQLTASIARAR